MVVKHQIPSTNSQIIAKNPKIFGNWSLEIGICLEFGIWLLEFFSFQLPKEFQTAIF